MERKRFLLQEKERPRSLLIYLIMICLGMLSGDYKSTQIYKNIRNNQCWRLFLYRIVSHKEIVFTYSNCTFSLSLLLLFAMITIRRPLIGNQWQVCLLCRRRRRRKGGHFWVKNELHHIHWTQQWFNSESVKQWFTYLSMFF